MTALRLGKYKYKARRVFDLLRDMADVLFTICRPNTAIEITENKRLTFVQFGDYAEAYRRFEAGGAETYYAQRYSVDFVTSLAANDEIASVTVINLCSDVPAALLPNGVHTRGIHLFPEGQPPRHSELVAAVEATSPTYLVVMSPCISLIAWALRNKIPVLPMFADSFRSTGFRANLEYRLLTLLLNQSAIEFVANHNLAASLDLKRIGVYADKILPFDWPALISPRAFEAKSIPPADRAFRLIYVGSVIETKGVGDAIQAVAKLRNRGREVELTVIGRGDLDHFQEMAVSQKVAKYVHFLGGKAHDDVIAMMRDHDAVVVPSHWSYPEGLPMTLYEALCTRTPLLTSNHPMFALRIRDQYNALVFQERDPEALARCIEILADTPQIYEMLSANSAAAADNYLCPLKYDRLITCFLSADGRRQLTSYSLRAYEAGG